MSALGLVHLPTPLDAAERLSVALGGPRVLVKRDDLTGLALGGNKARKLELLGQEAVDRRCDTLVTGGGPQSNHARITAAAARRLGMDCHLALAGKPPARAEGNLLLDHLLGATLRFPGTRDYYDIEASIDALAAELAADGRTPFAIPVGGASVTGAVAYALAVDELRAQIGDDPDWIVVADGSGGTHAGLLAGLGAWSSTRVLGVDVGTRPDLDVIVPKLAAEAAAARGSEAPVKAAIIDHDHVGEGYGQASPACVDAMRAFAREEGLILDPVYSGKAAAAMATWIRDGRIGADETVVFWHTGGAPAMFAAAYESALTQE